MRVTPIDELSMPRFELSTRVQGHRSAETANREFMLLTPSVTYGWIHLRLCHSNSTFY